MANKYVKKKNHTIDIQMIMICILIGFIAVMVTAVGQRMKYKLRIEEINASHEEEITILRSELQKDYDAKLAEIEQYYEYGANISQIELEAEYISKVIYGTARNHADSDKRAVVWCILNRVEHYAHPNTVAEVCKQPKQWMGYSDDNPVLSDIYDLVLVELKTWHNNGHRPLSNEYIYLSWSSKEILLRDTFEENKNTNYWRMR